MAHNSAVYSFNLAVLKEPPDFPIVEDVGLLEVLQCSSICRAVLGMTPLIKNLVGFRLTWP